MEEPSSEETQMGQRKWEDLSVDCLVNIFGRVGIESLVLDVPFVCKSWYQATLSPLCWRILVFPKLSSYLCYYNDFTSRLMDEYGIQGNFPVTPFIKFVINRSCGSAAMIQIPSSCTEEALVYVADRCPTLEALLLPSDLSYECVCKFPDLISRWKDLKVLRLGRTFEMHEILSQISINCKNFFGLGVSRAFIGKDEASAIVSLLPSIKYLSLRQASIERDNLVTILQGCKQLVEFDVRECIGFEGDGEILKLASHIRTFKCEGSRAEPWDDYFDDVNYRDDGFHDGCFSD